MRIFKNFILILCIISFFNFGNIVKTRAAYFLPKKQANIAFVGFGNSGKSGLRATLAGVPFNFNTQSEHTIRDDVLIRGLEVNDGRGHNYSIDCKLWDTSGEPKDKDQVIDFRCKYMDIVVIMVSLYDPRGDRNWKKMIRRNVLEWQNQILETNPNAKIILACTKCDLVDPNQLNTIEATINNFTNADRDLDEDVRSVVVSARSRHNLNALMQIIENDLREIGLEHLKDIDVEIPIEPKGGCLLL